MKTVADKILEFYASLSPELLPEDIEALIPFENQYSFSLMTSFYQKYYNDHNRRIFMIGINPGRLGGGITGIPFTDPVALKEFCSIDNTLNKKRELSSRFIYDLIDVFGGCEVFYKKIYFTSVSPIGFVKSGVNINYYDSAQLYSQWKLKMVGWLKSQVETFGRNDLGICIGMGKNFQFLESINNEFAIFNQLKNLPHPRWIMQYKLKDKENYIKDYIEVINRN